MFKCSGCGISKPKDKQHNVPVIIRKVKYINQVRIDKPKFDGDSVTTESIFKIVKQTAGTEIVKEEKYCKLCIPKNIAPKIIGEVVRENLIGIQRTFRGED